MSVVSRRHAMAFHLLTIGTLAAFAWTFLVPQEAIAQATVKIPAGTAVVVRTNSTITPDQVRVGDTVQLTVVQDVSIDGKVVIEAGSLATGEITESKDRNYAGIAGAVGLSVRRVQAVDGTTVPLSGSRYIEGKNKMVMSIGIGLLCCLLALLMKGGDASIAADSEIQCTVAGTTSVKVR